MTIKLITENAIAFVYHGDWVAECPMPDCGNVEHLFDPAGRGGPRIIPRPLFACSYCGLKDIQVLWPDGNLMAGVMGALSRRPVPHTRNWYPADHPMAVRLRIPEHGQTVDDLLAENAEHGVD